MMVKILWTHTRSRLGAFWIKFGGWHSEGENILAGREKKNFERGGAVKLLETKAGGAGEDL